MNEHCFSYYSYWSEEVVTFYGKKVYQMTKEEFIQEFEEVCTRVVDAEKHSKIPDGLITRTGLRKSFSVERGYTDNEIADYQRQLYLGGRERRPQFQVNGKDYTFDDISLKRYGESIDGKGRARQDSDWLWRMWQKHIRIDEAKYLPNFQFSP